MDDVDYLVEDNTSVDFAYHRRWMEPKVGWHNDGASWEQIPNAGNDSSNWKETQQQRVSPLLKIYSITEEARSNPS